jgi:hypothetical protein
MATPFASIPRRMRTPARCFITRLTGAWSATRNSGIEQAYADIYVAADSSYHMGDR